MLNNFEHSYDYAKSIMRLDNRNTFRNESFSPDTLYRIKDGEIQFRYKNNDWVRSQVAELVLGQYKWTQVDRFPTKFEELLDRCPYISTYSYDINSWDPPKFTIGLCGGTNVVISKEEDVVAIEKLAAAIRWFSGWENK